MPSLGLFCVYSKLRFSLFYWSIRQEILVDKVLFNKRDDNDDADFDGDKAQASVNIYATDSDWLYPAVDDGALDEAGVTVEETGDETRQEHRGAEAANIGMR